MAEPSYGTPTDLANLSVLNAAVLAGIPVAAQTAALDARSRYADSFLRAFYTLPLSAWASDLTRAVVDLAAYDLLSNRGYDPTHGADVNVRMRAEDAQRWFDGVSAGRIKPSVTDSAAGSSEGSTSGGPRVVSSSGRGWSRRGSSSSDGGPFTGD